MGGLQTRPAPLWPSNLIHLKFGTPQQGEWLASWLLLPRKAVGGIEGTPRSGIPSDLVMMPGRTPEQLQCFLPKFKT
jgi:hypothetical protein